MVLDPDLLDRARTTATGSADAERQALLARAEYHTAVRRLHLAGGSLREIAQALAMSHQRVQQIVSGAGGSWWRRVWRTRTVRADAVCTWCGRPPSEVAKLIAGPHVYICDRCLQRAELAVEGRAASAPFARPAKRPVVARCAFCGRRSTGGRSVVTAEAGNVCTDCLRVCREIVDASAA